MVFPILYRKISTWVRSPVVGPQILRARREDPLPFSPYSQDGSLLQSRKDTRADRELAGVFAKQQSGVVASRVNAGAERGPKECVDADP